MRARHIAAAPVTSSWRSSWRGPRREPRRVWRMRASSTAKMAVHPSSSPCELNRARASCSPTSTCSCRPWSPAAASGTPVRSGTPPRGAPREFGGAASPTASPSSAGHRMSAQLSASSGLVVGQAMILSVGGSHAGGLRATDRRCHTTSSPRSSGRWGSSPRTHRTYGSGARSLFGRIGFPQIKLTMVGGPVGLRG